jgi:hypothetical protein
MKRAIFSYIIRHPRGVSTALAWFAIFCSVTFWTGVATFAGWHAFALWAFFGMSAAARTAEKAIRATFGSAKVITTAELKADAKTGAE